uniref:FAST kinase domain-containing protein 5, mitochondrial n=1 Tax=Scatophagus argus TaxID=75038 RepID=UPI001ED7F0D1|nr:FAST kinase domain-containing protein 5, mitochondrial [Scatophagus argus]
MAACVLYRRVARLRYLPGLRTNSNQTQDVRVKQVDETDDYEGKKGVLQPQGTSLQGGYRLYYNPNSYCSMSNSATSQSRADNDEDECVSTLTPSLWQQSNRYSVSCSRHISSSKNSLLDLDFNKDSEPEILSESLDHGKPIPPDIKPDTRAYLKCRPGYASTTLDLTQGPHPIKWEEAMSLLNKVTVLKGRMKPSDVSQFLVELSRLHPDRISLVKSDQRFIMLLRYCVEHLCFFTPHQLLEVLQSFVWLDMPSTHTVLAVYEAELISRVNQMSLHQLMLAADLWRCIGRQVPQFLQHLYDSVRMNLGQMGIPELVQLLYIMGEGRHCPEALIRPIEQLLMQHLHQLYPEEVGTVCLGLFKSQTSISDDVVTRIIDKAHSFVEEMSDFALVNVLKFMRFSYQYHRLWLESLEKEVPRRAHRMGVQGLMHVALACSALHFCSDKILTAVAERVPPLVQHCRSKDSGKLLWAFGTLGFLPVQSPSFYPSLTKSLRQRKVEFQRYPQHLLTGLLGLAFVSQFPEDLIALALSPEFINFALKSKQLELKKDLFTLDGTVAIELPQWTGPRLSCELREEVTEMLWKFVHSDVCQKPEVQEAEAALQDLLGGEKFVCKRMILPHTRSIDLEVHLKSTGQPIPVNPPSDTATVSAENRSSKFSSRQGWGRMNLGVTITDDLIAQLTNTKNPTKSLTPSPTCKRASLHSTWPDESCSMFDTGLVLTSDRREALTRIISQDSAPQDTESTVKLAIQVTTRNQHCIQSQQLLGLHALKRRQLKLAGYRVVEIYHQEWLHILRKSRSEKLAYLHCKIYDSL